MNEESHIDVQLDQRHMMLRGDTVREKEREGEENLMEGRGEKEGWMDATSCDSMSVLSFAAFQDIQDTLVCDSVVRDLVMTCGQVINWRTKLPIAVD